MMTTMPGLATSRLLWFSFCLLFCRIHAALEYSDLERRQSTTTITTCNEPYEPFDFSCIPEAQTVNESIARYQDRKNLVLEWFTQSTLPFDCQGVDSDNDPTTYCLLDTRSETRRLCDWTIANLILGRNVSAAETILLNSETIPFGITGSGVSKLDPNAVCYRKGDYDFALINFLHLVYTYRTQDPAYLTNPAYLKIVNELLTFFGSEHDQYVGLQCRVWWFTVNIRFEDTENHVVMEEVAQYLTNQLKAELDSLSGIYNEGLDNEVNDNNAFMLDFLGQFFTEYFDEYNSRNYQGYTMLALTLLRDHAQDTRVVTAATMLMDLVTGWSAIQTNKGRRYSPFRRQNEFILADEIEKTQGWFAWAGDGGT